MIWPKITQAGLFLALSGRPNFFEKYQMICILIGTALCRQDALVLAAGSSMAHRGSAMDRGLIEFVVSHAKRFDTVLARKTRLGT